MMRVPHKTHRATAVSLAAHVAVVVPLLLVLSVCNQAHPKWDEAGILALLPMAAPTETPTTAPKRKVFVTTATMAGHMGGATGVAAADAACAADGNYPGTGTYKALIVDGVARVACTTANCAGGVAEHTAWVLQPSTQYVRAGDAAVVLTTNVDGIFNFAGTLTNSFDAGAPVTYWTGITNNWVLSAKHCTAWTNGVGGGPNTGQAGLSNAITQNAIRDAGFTDCGTLTRLLCIEQ